VIDLEIVVDRQMPRHAVYATADGDAVRVTVSPEIEPAVLGVLNEQIGSTIADALAGKITKE
jgi:hypothetical protein